MEDWTVIAVSKLELGAPVPGAQASISADLLNRQSALERLGDAKGATHVFYAAYAPRARFVAIAWRGLCPNAVALSCAARMAFRAKPLRANSASMSTRWGSGCHTFRTTGITAYLEAGGTLENAQAMAEHESPRTTKLYDRTGDEITLDEVERITI
ncbi:MAG TPA: hypothetical protein VIF02_07395 [Methylocella sp.]